MNEIQKARALVGMPFPEEEASSRQQLSSFEKWTCTFPGKLGLSWKRAWHGEGTKEEAETEAAKNCNVGAVPVQLLEKMQEFELRTVVAEGKLSELGIVIRYEGRNPIFISIHEKKDSHEDKHRPERDVQDGEVPG